jgi:hypothetical protein
MVVGSVAAMICLAVLFEFVYPNPRIFAAVLVLLAALNMLLERALNIRLKRAVREMQYQG